MSLPAPVQMSLQKRICFTDCCISVFVFCISVFVFVFLFIIIIVTVIIIIMVLEEFQMAEQYLVVEKPLLPVKSINFPGKCKYFLLVMVMMVMLMVVVVMVVTMMHKRTLLPSGTLHIFPATRCRTPNSLHHHCHHQHIHHSWTM